MILALVGSDEFGKEERLELFWKDALADGSQRAIFFATEYIKDESSLAAAVAQAMAPSFFGPGASVLVRHCEYLPAEEQRRLAGFLPEVQGNLALDFSEIDKRSSLSKFLEKQGVVELFVPPKYDFQKWITNHVQKYFGKRKIEHSAALYIADAIGNDTKRVHNEIKKILTYDPAIQEIKLQHCSLFIKQDREVPAYELQMPFGLRNPAEFLPKLRRILAEGGIEAMMPVIGALRSHCITLLHINAMRAKKMPDYDIISRVMLPNQARFYQQNKMPEQSSRWRLDGLQKVILRLDELSYGIKMGSYGDLPSFELAICGLML